MAVTGAALSIEDLAIGYGRHAIGTGISLGCGRGDGLALLGPNGSGKTTLFKTILGLLPPLAGRILVDGEDTRHWRPAERARCFGYVPQSAPGYFPFLVEDVVTMGRTARIGIFSGPSAADRSKVADIIDTLGLGHLAGRAFTEISGGERQLVLIARALAQEPRILVLDEPTASLDFAHQLMVLDIVRRLSRDGLTVILSTHHPDEAFACTGRAALLKQGRLIAHGATSAVLTDAGLSRLYDVPLAVRTVDGWTTCIPADASRSVPPAVTPSRD